MILDSTKPLSLAEAIGSMLASIVEAQAQAARATIEFIGNFTAGSETGKELINVRFRYRKLDENREPREFLLEIPLLGMVNIPQVSIAKATLSFSYDITQTDPPGASQASGRDKAGSPGLVRQQRIGPPATMKGTFVRKPATVASSGTQVEQQQQGSLDVKIELERTPLTVGLDRILDVLELVGSGSAATPDWTWPPSTMKPIDIGTPKMAGSASYDADRKEWIVTAGGRDIWDKKDEFHYVYQRLSGDGQMTVRVTSLSPDVSDWAKAGIMIRESLDAGSKFAMMLASTRQGVSFQYRPAADRECDFKQTPGLRAPISLQLKRVGNSLAGYYYMDGAWQCQACVSIPMKQDVYIGLAVTSHNETEMVQARFDPFC